MTVIYLPADIFSNTTRFATEVFCAIICPVAEIKITVAEFEDNLQGALVKFHQTAANLWNAPDVLRANLRIVDENQNTVMGKSEDIGHDAPAEPVVPEEQTEE